MFLKLGGNYDFNNSIYAHQPFSSHVVSPSTPDRPSFPSPTQMLSSGTIIASIILTKRQRNPKYHNHGISPFFLIVLCQVRLGTTFGAVLLKDALQRPPPPHPLTSHQTTHLNAFPARIFDWSKYFTPIEICGDPPKCLPSQNNKISNFKYQNIKNPPKCLPSQELEILLGELAAARGFKLHIQSVRHLLHHNMYLQRKICTCNQYQYQYQHNVYRQWCKAKLPATCTSTSTIRIFNIFLAPLGALIGLAF